MMSKTLQVGSAVLLAGLVATTAAVHAAGPFAGRIAPVNDAVVDVKKDGIDLDVTIGDGDRRRYADDYYDRDRGPDWYRERGYRRYDRRPDDWRDRSCVGVGPVHFCK